MRAATPCRLSCLRALARVALVARGPDLTVNASRVSGGSCSQTSPKSYGPLIAATARILGSNAAARGA